MLNTITKDFPEVAAILERHKKAQKEMRSCDRRLHSLKEKYSFLEVIIGIGIDDTKLGDAVKKLLKDAGFDKVVHYVSPRIKPKREDILAYSGNDLIVIEVKGISAAMPRHKDLTQVARYIAETKKRQLDKTVTGIAIINHDKNTHPTNRTQGFTDTERNNDAKNLNYGFISTIDLVVGFWQLKTNIITFEQFKTRLQGTGFITFDSKGGKTRRQIGL